MLAWIVLAAGCQVSGGHAAQTGEGGEDPDPCTAIEICNSEDDDCDGIVDEDAADFTAYTDADGDGYGGGSAPDACDGDPGVAAAGGDCDDDHPATFPGAPEVCGDGVVNDCDGGSPCRYGPQSSLSTAALRVLTDDYVGFDTAIGVGDMDGDGRHEVAFGAHLWEVDGVETAGAVFVFAGQTGDLVPTDAARRSWGGVADNGLGTYVGYQLYAMGDVVPGDGPEVGILAYPSVYLLTPEAPQDAVVTTLPDTIAATRSASCCAAARKGLAGAGDVDGDGHDDVVRSDPSWGYDPIATTNRGAVYLHRGPVDGAVGVEQADTTWLGEGDPLLGWNVDHVGDLDGDGRAEVAFTALNPFDEPDTHDSGAVFVASAPAPGNHSMWDVDSILAGSRNQGAGVDFAGSNDIDYDGYGDLVIGAVSGWTSTEDPPTQPYVGWLVRGPLPSGQTSLEQADATFLTEYGYEGVRGVGVANPGDMDGDGNGEVVLGLSRAANERGAVGAIAIFYGPVQGTHLWSDADGILWGEVDWDQPGGPNNLDAAGDYDGDGLADLVVGAMGGYPGNPEPAGWVVLGGNW